MLYVKEKEKKRTTHFLYTFLKHLTTKRNHDVFKTAKPTIGLLQQD